MTKETTTYDMSAGGKAHWALTMFSFEEFLLFWPIIQKEMDKIPETWKHWTKDYIVGAVENGTLQVWGIGPPPRAVLVFFTQVAIYPATKVLLVPWGFGNFKREMLPTIEAALNNYAQMNDCGSIEVRGRPGWERHFKTIGMTREAVIWSIPVTNSRVN